MGRSSEVPVWARVRAQGSALTPSQPLRPIPRPRAGGVVLRTALARRAGSRQLRRPPPAPRHRLPTGPRPEPSAGRPGWRRWDAPSARTADSWAPVGQGEDVRSLFQSIGHMFERLPNVLVALPQGPPPGRGEPSFGLRLSRPEGQEGSGPRPRQPARDQGGQHPGLDAGDLQTA